MRIVYDLLGEYKCFLETYHSERCKSFHELCCTQPEAARAEAVIFSFFRWNGYDIRVEEILSRGGVDFRVQTENTEFVVEVTSIAKRTFTRRSGAPEIPISGKGYHPDPYKVARQIRNKALEKEKQMTGYDCPTILTITCEHPEYGYFLQSKDNDFNPCMFITSPPGAEMRYDPESYTSHIVGNTTDLKYSLFFRFNKRNRIVFCRKQISAMLLFYIDEKYGAEIVGLLHPRPNYQFSHELLPSVPFVKALIPERVLTSEMADYSVEDFDNQIRTRWIPNNLPDGLFRYN